MESSITKEALEREQQLKREEERRTKKKARDLPQPTLESYHICEYEIHEFDMIAREQAVNEKTNLESMSHT
jgi:hypothetical protein